MKFGRKPAVRNAKIPALAKFIRGAVLPPPPQESYWYDGDMTFPMDANDRYGCCVFAGWAHARQAWSHYVRNADDVMAEQDVLAMYSAFTGFNPDDPNTDNGAVMSDVVARLVAQGDGFGNQPQGAATLNILHTDDIKDAIDLFGGCYAGINAPQSILSGGDTWGVVPDDPIVGGHCIWYCAYDQASIYAVSWGRVYRLTWAFSAKYLEEAYAFLDLEFTRDNTMPAGIDLDQWRRDMEALKAA